MKKINEMTTKEFKEYEKKIAFDDMALDSEIDFIMEDSNFVVCKNGKIKINPKSELRKYLRIRFKQEEKEKIKKTFILIK